MKIAVAIPVYDGKLQVQTVTALLNEQVIALNLGDEIRVRFLPNCSHPAMGRNQLVQDFLDSEGERLIFLDADITFEPGSLVKIAHYPVDFVGGAYRLKKDDEENYPVGWLPNVPEIRANSLGLVEVQTLPGGFLSLSRNVFEILKAKFPERSYAHFGKVAHAYFQMPFYDGHLWGEDSFFCKEWGDCGGKIYLDPELTLTHWKFDKPYVGHIGNWLKKRYQEELANRAAYETAQAIRANIERQKSEVTA